MLSVVLPLYNGEKFIEEAIRYIQKAEYSDLEIIVVNDGSTDRSTFIVKKLQNEDSRIVLYNKDNGGVVSARNYGAEKARGEFICFMDQDDIVKPFMYSKLIERMIDEKSDVGMCSSGRIINGNESGFDILDDNCYEEDDVRKELLYPILFNGYDIPIDIGKKKHYPHIWTCIFRTEFWKQNNINFRAYINFEDDLLVKVETLAKAKRVSTISDIGYLWRVNLRSETYAHHFVNDIGKKQELSYIDMNNSLKSCNADRKTLELFKQVTYCKQYVDAIHNLSSPETKKNRLFIKKYYKENIYNRDFDNAIQGRKYLKKGQVKPGFLLPVLARKNTMLSYRLELLLDKILLISLHSNILTKMERNLKK